MTICKKNVKCNIDNSSKPQKFLILFLAGFFLTLIGIVILVFTTVFYGEGSPSFGAIIFIGPFPIVIGAGPEATWMILFAIILGILSIAMFLILRRETAETKV